MPDNRLEPRTAGKNPKHYRFGGHHERLVTDALYTLSQVALIVGLNSKTMHSRMRGKTEISNREIRETQDPFGGNNKGREGLYDRLETVAMKESGKWLRVKL